MSNTGHDFYVPFPDQVDNIDDPASIYQRIQQQLSQYEPASQGSTLIPTTAYDSFDAATMNGHPGVTSTGGQEQYPNKIDDLQHIALAAMEGRTPDHVSYAGAMTPSPATGEFATEVTPMGPNMLSKPGYQGHGTASMSFQGVSSGEIFPHPGALHQQSAMSHRRLWQPQALRPNPYHLLGANTGVAGSHIPSTSEQSHENHGPVQFASAASGISNPSPAAVAPTRSTGSQQPTTLAQTDQPSPTTLPSLEGTPSHPSSTSHSPISKESVQPKLTKKSPKSPKTRHGVMGTQPPMKLGPVSGPTVHPPQHDANSSMRTFKLSEKSQELTEHVPAKAFKRAANKASENGGDAVKDDDMRKSAKQVAKESDTESEPEMDTQPKTSVKSGRSARLAAVAKTTLPDYGATVLKFANRGDAVTSLQDRLNSIRDAFIPADQDNTIPQSDQQIQDAVKILLGAMKDLSQAKDKDSRGVRSRWMSGAKHPYSHEVMETTCWRIADLCIKLHRDGPSALSIGDPHYLPQIKKSAHLTFADRIKTIAILIREWKARNDGLIKGDTLQTVVAAPLEALLSASNNAGANKARGELLKIGQEHRPQKQGRKRKATDDTLETTPKTETRKRKQPKKKTEVFDNSAAAAEDAAANGNEAADGEAVEADQTLVSNDAVMSDVDDGVVSNHED